ncbi:hypothetical protein CWE12_07115 [Aliidiomarina sedimenti]|uniref:DUF1570 domain-containing protein n=1 Tax=Aliidiomarina sedimenti TaxID=1933879 RepID=A0ABY0BYN7_9GAMM|nr:hypothetical protein [Aliidiomarina sedimenti]RUO29734.1 hypothetical protein CWE12_07115 [Aliidiomarina sedimenti]
MNIKYRLWPLGLAFLSSVTFAECGPEPEGFESWPDDEAVPVESIPRKHWFRSAQGWVIAPSQCQAVEAAREREAAFEAFTHYFARTPLDGAIVDVQHAPALASIRAAGFAWALPWRFADDTASENSTDPRTQAIREQIEAQLSGAGRTPGPEQVERLLERALAQHPPAATSTATTLEPTALRHEVAHKLFIEGVWPSTRPGGTQYGGDAPDWLDEAAAITAESDEMTAGRRTEFRQLAREEKLVPLGSYLSMTHPVFNNSDLRELMREARERATEEGAAVLSASVSAEQIAEGRIFYAQTRGWLDYLLQQTGNPQILGNMADTMRNGQSFDEWLAQAGLDAGLPGSMEALEAEFEAWALMPDSLPTN